jgi:hypothetical protein
MKTCTVHINWSPGERRVGCVCVSSVYKHQDAELLMLNVYNKSKKVFAGNSFVDKTAHLLSSLLFVEVLLILNNPPGPLPPPRPFIHQVIDFGL